MRVKAHDGAVDGNEPISYGEVRTLIGDVTRMELRDVDALRILAQQNVEAACRSCMQVGTGTPFFWGPVGGGPCREGHDCALDPPHGSTTRAPRPPART